MNNYAEEILIRYGLISIPSSSSEEESSLESFATILNNLFYYGYGLSPLAYDKLRHLSEENLRIWWQKIEPIFQQITGENKQIQKFVVYKNFPQEILAMSEAEYWCRQILMYWGFPNEYFTQSEEKRPSLIEKLSCRILQLARDNSLLQILEEILYLPNRWTEEQWQDIIYLLPQFINNIESNKIKFKDNLIKVLIYCLEQNQTIKINSTMDVLRLTIELSGGKINSNKKIKFRTFKRKERRFLLNLLNNCPYLSEDINRQKNVWKKLFFALHPGDYKDKFPKVVKAYNQLYNNQKIDTFNNQLERLLESKNSQVLSLLQSRPGEFVRRLKHCLDLFGEEAIIAFVKVIPRLRLIQLLKLHKYLETINDRLYRTIAPKGNWTKLQVLKLNDHDYIDTLLQEKILNTIAQEIKHRISSIVPEVNLDPQTAFIKIQNNDSSLTKYGRGTIFIIPENVKFLRTVSYWRSGKTKYNIWYDNGWNFFNELWNPQGSCCWDYPYFTDHSAIFSGDPTNSKDAEGNACQIIDLYLDKLLAQNIRYAVWNILCFSHVSFNLAEEVYAALQWGEKPTTGKLFEPSRAQLSFPIKGDNFTKYIVLIDLYKNHLIYLDANLYARVTSASLNLGNLQEKMPPFMEYLESLPSVFDLFKHQDRSEKGLNIAYSDKNIELNGEQAYIFKTENNKNNFQSFSLTQILNL